VEKYWINFLISVLSLLNYSNVSQKSGFKLTLILNNKNTKNIVKTGLRTFIDFSHKKINKWPIQCFNNNKWCEKIFNIILVIREMQIKLDITSLPLECGLKLLYYWFSIVFLMLCSVTNCGNYCKMFYIQFYLIRFYTLSLSNVA
jgi:hypothetical protein